VPDRRDFVKGLIAAPLVAVSAASAYARLIEPYHYLISETDIYIRGLPAAFEVARRFVEQAPRLIPIHSHRYLPAEPNTAGNPVFSVYQADIIHYGRNLRSYLLHEFGKMTYTESVTPEPRDVRFWSDLVRRNNARTS